MSDSSSMPESARRAVRELERGLTPRDEVIAVRDTPPHGREAHHADDAIRLLAFGFLAAIHERAHDPEHDVLHCDFGDCPQAAALFADGMEAVPLGDDRATFRMRCHPHGPNGMGG